MLCLTIRFLIRSSFPSSYFLCRRSTPSSTSVGVRLVPRTKTALPPLPPALLPYPPRSSKPRKTSFTSAWAVSSSVINRSQPLLATTLHMPTPTTPTNAPSLRGCLTCSPPSLVRRWSVSPLRLTVDILSFVRVNGIWMGILVRSARFSRFGHWTGCMLRTHRRSRGR